MRPFYSITKYHRSFADNMLKTALSFNDRTKFEAMNKGFQMKACRVTEMASPFTVDFTDISEIHNNIDEISSI